MWPSRLATLVRIEKARGTTFKDVAFRDAEWNLPVNSAGDGQAAIGVPGAVQIAGGENVSMEGCRVEHVGTYWHRDPRRVRDQGG